MERETYTAEEVDAAVEALSDPKRLEHAQEVVTHAAPALQNVLQHALDAGGWFGDAHASQVRQIAALGDAGQIAAAMDDLVGEETRLGMLVGVTVGFELARELAAQRERQET